MLRSPLERLKNEHVECSLQQLNSVFILVFLAHRCRHSTAVAVDCLLLYHGGASIQIRAYSNSSDEIGIRSDTPVEAVRSASVRRSMPTWRRRSKANRLSCRFRIPRAFHVMVSFTSFRVARRP